MKTKNVFLVKFTTVAMMLGFFSPSVSVVSPDLQGVNQYSASSLQLSISLLNTAEARGGRGGGGGRGGMSRGGGSRGGMSRGGSSRGGSMNRGSGMNRSSGTSRNTGRDTRRDTSRDRSRDVNRNTNRNVNRNANVNHYYGGGGYHAGGGYGYGYWGGAAILAWTSAVVVGSWVAASTMPTTCTTFIHDGISYKQCGSSYYRPYYQGDTVVYQTVNSPY